MTLPISIARFLIKPKHLDRYVKPSLRQNNIFLAEATASNSAFESNNRTFSIDNCLTGAKNKTLSNSAFRSIGNNEFLRWKVYRNQVRNSYSKAACLRTKMCLKMLI